MHVLAVLALLSAAPGAAETAAPPPVETPALPAEDVVVGLRRARIAGEAGDRDGQRALLTALVTAHPEDPVVLAAALAFHRETEGETEASRALRGRLLGALARPGRTVPLSLLQEAARDANATSDELTQLLILLDAPPGTRPDRIARLRLRVALLDRLGRRDGLIAALDELVALDPDPLLAFRLLGLYREASRWEDLLRASARVDASRSGFDPRWWRLEALGALRRYDEMVGEASGILARWRARPMAGADPDARGAQLALARFFPMVFALVDAGRRELAERFVADLESAAPGLDEVRRLRVMLFGSPDERTAFLASLAGATIASVDPDKIRAEAYQRLLAKDYGTAHDLYRRLQELDPTTSAMDGTDWFNYGLASTETQAWADAEAAMTRVLAAGVSVPRAYAQRARARIMLGRAAEGMADAEAALAIDPKLKQACYAMYLAYQKFGNKEKADEWLARSKAP